MANVDGKYSLAKLTHELNTPFPNVTLQVGVLKVTSVKLLQAPKAVSPKEIDEESMPTFLMPDPLKAFFSMLITELGIEIPLLPFKEPAFSKADSLIVVKAVNLAKSNDDMAEQ